MKRILLIRPSVSRSVGQWVSGSADQYSSNRSVHCAMHLAVEFGASIEIKMVVNPG